MMRTKLLVLVAALLAFSCGNTRIVRVPVESRLAEAESPPRAVVSGIRVAVVQPDVANDPEGGVEFTNSFGESYATLSHEVVAVPQALREVGFDVVEVHKQEDLVGARVDYVLVLAKPEVAAVHPATGDRVTLVGSAYDVRVRYGGALASSTEEPLGVVVGYGQDTARFAFMEPLFKQAMVGAAISASTFVASVFMLYLVFNFGLIGSLASRSGEPFGLCSTDRGGSGAGLRFTPDLPFSTKEGTCAQLVSLAISAAFVTAVSSITGIAGSVGGKLGENVVDVGLAAAHLSIVDPTWRRMVKRAHDDAARDLAAAVVDRALHPYAVPRRPVPPPPPPGAVPVPVAPPVASPPARQPPPVITPPQPAPMVVPLRPQPRPTAPPAWSPPPGEDAQESPPPVRPAPSRPPRGPGQPPPPVLPEPERLDPAPVLPQD